MTARISFACDGVIPGGGYPCRQAIYAGELLTGAAARRVAAQFDWTSHLEVAKDGTERVVDLCPACSTRRLRARVAAATAPPNVITR